MKKLLITSTLALLVTAWSMLGAQNYPAEYLGLPGDNLNLYATMKLFQESETLESFEKGLNDENSRINNLDLNGDNMVDYIMVIDYVDGDVHSIVLRAALDREETQDVAVFTVQRFSNGEVQIQLVGDEALYGRNYIVEPIYADNELETPNPGYTGNNRNVAVVRTTTYEIAAWPVVRYIYLPSYVSWHSSWHWNYYPGYWNSWRPFYWHTYYGYHYNMHNYYYRHYRTWNHHRYNNYNNFYYSRIRTYSPRVRARINSGNYRNTYSRPDLRKNGEALYARTNSVKNVRTRNTTSNDNRRINNSQSTRSRSIESNRSGVGRSSATNVNRRITSGSPAIRGTETSRKSAAVGNNRNVQNNAAGKDAYSRRNASNTYTRVAPNSSAERGINTSRKTANVSNNRVVKSSSVGQNNGNSQRQRSSANVSNRSVYRTPQASRSVSSRSSSGQSQTKSAVSSRSSGSRSRTAVSSRSSGNSSRSSGQRNGNSRSSSTNRSGRR